MSDDGLETFRQEVIRRESGGRPYVGTGGADLSTAPLDQFGFPRWAGIDTPKGKSHAAGLYGFQPGTWAKYAAPLGIRDFSPESQTKVFHAAHRAEGEAPWRPFWLAPQRGPTSAYDPDTGRTEPRIEFNAVVGQDPLDLILMAASQNEPATKPKDDDALALLNSFIEPPGAAQGHATPPEAMTGGEPLPAPTAPPQPIATHIGGIESRTPRQDTIEPPGPGQIVSPAPPQPQRQAAPIQQAASPLDEILRYAETSVHAMKPALTEIPKAAGEIGQAALGIGERAGLAEAQMEPGTAPQPQIPIRPGMERIGDAATFATGGLLSPLGVPRPTAVPRGASPHQLMPDNAGVGGILPRPAMPAHPANPLDVIMEAARGAVASEQGAVSLPPAVQRGLEDVGKGIEKFFSPTTVDAESRYGEALIREQTGQARQSSAAAGAQVGRRGTIANPKANLVRDPKAFAHSMVREPWRPLVNRHIPAFGRYIAEKQAGLNPPKPPLLHFLDFVETRGQGTTYQGPPELRGLADKLQKIFADRRMAIAAEPSTNWVGFVDDYFAHSWKDPNAARAAFAQPSAGTGRQGSGRNLRQRIIPTISEGIDRGLVPATLDPIEATMSYVVNMDRYLAHNRIFRIARDDGKIEFHASQGEAPSGWMQLTGRLAEKAVSTGGIPEALGLHAFAPSGFARIYNRSVSTGFLAGELGPRWYEAALHAKNGVTQSVLSLSGYHYLAMMQEANASAFAMGIQNLKDGEIKEGLRQLGLGVTLIGKTVDQVFRVGRKVEQQYLGIEDHGPDFARAANLYAGAGGRMTRGAEYRNTAASNYFTSFRRGAMRMDWQTGLAKVREGNPVTAPLRAAGFLGREMGRIMETVTAPLFDKMVPRLKAAAFYDEMSGWLGQNPLASHGEQLAHARRISDTIDDRFGEMVMDNIFWGQRTKQTLQLLATSLGWEFGSMRSLGGAPADLFIKREFSPRVRYAAGLGAAIALENAVYQYIKTGQLPGEAVGGPFSPGALVDLSFPRTGGRTPDGNYERGLLPGFEKDIQGYMHDPFAEVAGKLTPGAKIGLDVGYSGKDYFGHTIAPLPKYTPDWFNAYTKHVFKEMRPIPLAQDKLKGSNIGMAERWMGIRPAPGRWQNPQLVDRAELQRDIGELRGQLRRLWSHGNRTTEERKSLLEKQKEIVRQIDELARQLGARPAPSRIYRPQGASP